MTEHGRLRQGAGGHPRGDRRRRGLVLPMLFREQYVTRQWFEVVGNTPEEFATYLESEIARWDRLIKLSGVRVE